MSCITFGFCVFIHHNVYILKYLLRFSTEGTKDLLDIIPDSVSKRLSLHSSPKTGTVKVCFFFFFNFLKLIFIGE